LYNKHLRNLLQFFLHIKYPHRKMNILIVGSGGREHALAWKIKQSPLCENLYIAPGNAGTAQVGTNIGIGVNDFDTLAIFCTTNNIDMLVVGPEDPLVNGIFDYFAKHSTLSHLKVIGPSKHAAQLEGSKAFAKAFMKRHQIPTAAYQEFNASNYLAGVEYLKTHPLPIVLKADGLAAGKGVLICHSRMEALAEFELMIQQSKFGDAGKKVVVEEFLDGIEMSVFALTDGKDYVLLPEAKDYKRIGRGDTGLNTGGMGAVSPVPFANDAFMQKVISKVVEPTINGLYQEQFSYQGVVFIGLIKVKDEPYVIEYNCRFGDPETEVVIPRVINDLVEVFDAVAQKKLAQVNIRTVSDTAVTVVAVSGGYPNAYKTGYAIRGLDDEPINGTIVFHAGTKPGENGLVLSNGGRVLAVTSFGDNVKEAAEQSFYQLDHIFFDDIYFRDDIGFEFVNETSTAKPSVEE
jgi:phosphoribosylamine--glycine ligase